MRAEQDFLKVVNMRVAADLPGPTGSIHHNLNAISQSIGNSIYTLAWGLSSPHALDKISNSIERSVKPRFHRHIANAANINRSSLWHMYEPNHIGSTRYRLFDFNIVRHIEGADFGAAVSFRPSSMLVSLTEMQATPGKTGKVVKKRHRFYNKAEVLEFGKPIVIKPKHGKYLVFEPRPGFLSFVRGKGEKPAVIRMQTKNRSTYGAFNVQMEKFFTGPGRQIGLAAIEKYSKNVLKNAELAALIRNSNISSDAVAKGIGSSMGSKAPEVSV
jgi:hypothetical protein